MCSRSSPRCWPVPVHLGGVTTFKQDRTCTSRQQPVLFNRAPTTDHVDLLFTATGFVTFVGTPCGRRAGRAVTLVLGLPAAYALARLDRRWAGPLGIAIFFVYLVPPTLLFLSLSRIVVGLGLQDSTWSLVLIYPTITVPVSVWLLIGFLKTIPRTSRSRRWSTGTAGSARCGGVCAAAGARDRGCDRLRVHADRQRVHLRARLHLAKRGEGDQHRRTDRAGAGRRVPLAVAAGRHDPGGRADRAAVQRVPEPLHHRVHHGRGQGRETSGRRPTRRPSARRPSPRLRRRPAPRPRAAPRRRDRP